MFDELERDGFERVAVLEQHLADARFLLAEDPGHLVVDDAGGLLRPGRAPPDVTGDGAVVGRPGHGTEPLRHAPLEHHVPSGARGAGQVVGRPRRGLTEHHLLRGPATELDRDRVEQVAAAVEVALDLRQLLGDAERHPAREHGDLVDRIGVLAQDGDHRVAGLVVGDDALLVVRQDERRAPQAHQHPVVCPVEVLGRQARVATPDGTHAASFTTLASSAPLIPGVPRATTSRSTSSPSCLPSQWTRRISTRLVQRRKRDEDLPVEATRAQQRGVEDFGPVGGGHHDDPLGRSRSRPSPTGSG